MKRNKLSEFEEFVLLQKGTEPPFTGEYEDFFEDGIYFCKLCSSPLFDSTAKFKSHCGWASFDESLETVKRVPDTDGIRVEILCANCGGHLGHVFEGEGFTAKNTRHCVNSASISFKNRD